jgi:hypothetical protein
MLLVDVSHMFINAEATPNTPSVWFVLVCDQMEHDCFAFHSPFQLFFGVISLCMDLCLMHVTGYKVGRVEQVETVSAQKDRVQQEKAASAGRSADDKVVKRGMCGILTKGTLCDAELIGMICFVFVFVFVLFANALMIYLRWFSTTVLDLQFFFCWLLSFCDDFNFIGVHASVFV